MLVLNYGDWTFWEAYNPPQYFGGLKVTFDGVNRLITVNEGVTALDIKEDVYEAWKKWKVEPLHLNTRFIQAMRTTGGDDTIDGEKAGDIYFLVNGWKLVYDPRETAVTGVLFSDDFDTAFYLRETLEAIYPTKVSSLVTRSVSTGTSGSSAEDVWSYSNRTLTSTTPSATDIANEVWSSNSAVHTTHEDTMGHLLSKLSYITKKVYVDTDALTNGDGSQSSPYNNVTDAIDYAEEHNIRDIILSGDIILDRNLKNFTIYGIGVPEVDLADNDISGSHFHQCQIKGNFTFNKPVVIRDSLIKDGAYIGGFIENSVLEGDVICKAGTTLLKDVTSYADGLNHVIDCNNENVNLTFGGYKGGLIITNCTSNTNVLDINVDPGEVTLDSTVTEGTIVIRGFCTFTDNSTGNTNVVDRTGIQVASSITQTDLNNISSAVWNKLLADMLVADSAGDRLKALLTVNKYLGLQ